MSTSPRSFERDVRASESHEDRWRLWWARRYPNATAFPAFGFAGGGIDLQLEGVDRIVAHNPATPEREVWLVDEKLDSYAAKTGNLALEVYSKFYGAEDPDNVRGWALFPKCTTHVAYAFGARVVLMDAVALALWMGENQDILFNRCMDTESALWRSWRIANPSTSTDSGARWTTLCLCIPLAWLERNAPHIFVS